MALVDLYLPAALHSEVCRARAGNPPVCTCNARASGSQPYGSGEAPERGAWPGTGGGSPTPPAGEGVAAASPAATPDPGFRPFTSELVGQVAWSTTLRDSNDLPRGGMVYDVGFDDAGRECVFTVEVRPARPPRIHILRLPLDEVARPLDPSSPARMVGKLRWLAGLIRDRGKAGWDPRIDDPLLDFANNVREAWRNPVGVR